MAAVSLQANGLFLSSTKALGSIRSNNEGFGNVKQGKKVLTVTASAQNQIDNQKVLVASALAVSSLLATPQKSYAIEATDITNAISQVEAAANQITSQALESYEAVKSVVDQVVTVSKPVVDAATPVVQQAAQKAIELASPVAADVASKAQQALSDAGVDTAPVFEAAKTAAAVGSTVTSSTGKAITDATPFAQSTLETLLAQDPSILALGVGGLVLLYLLTPSIGSAIVYSARGYAGDLTAAQTLDLLTTSNYFLIDVRTEKEKAKTGIPSLPRGAQNKRFFVPVEDLPSKIRSQLRNARSVEAELTAIKIAALKKLNKGSNIALLDSNGSIVKQVAKSLSKLGFGNVYIVKDGTDGSTGWVQSQLAVESFRASPLEILSPSRVVSGSTGLLNSKSSTVVVPPARKGFLLPGGDE